MSISPKTVSFVCDSCLRTLRTPRSTYLQAYKRLRISPSATYTTTSRCPPSRIRNEGLITAAAARTAFRTTSPRSAFRPFSTYIDSAPPLVANSGIAPLLHRRLVSLTGADAPKFLQGLITHNVDPNNSEPFYSAFLDARGRVLWDVFVYPRQDLDEPRYYIEVDGKEVESLLRHLKRHKLRSKILIEIVKQEEDGLGVYAAWGIPQEQLKQDAMISGMEDPRAADFGFRLLVRGQPQWDKGIERLMLEQYLLRRYLYGIAEGQDEIPKESALPMECNIDLSSGIDFRKGCYVGQELTIRTKHTGVVRKRILPVQLYRKGEPEPEEDELRYDAEWKGNTQILEGADIKQLDEDGSIKKGRSAGKFIAGIGNVGLALCRLEMMTPMRVSAEGGTYKPGIKFGLQGPEGGSLPKQVRIKAVVPKWLREREKELWDKGRQKLPNV